MSDSAATSGGRKPARVLVADDDPAIRQLVSTIVRREGLEVDCAADGVEAIERLGAAEYGIILLDLMMPRADGFDVIAHLRTSPPAHKPVVLVVTAYADQRFKRVDPDVVSGVLRKPFEIADVGNIIRLCVRGFDEALQQEMSRAHDRTVRDFAATRGGETEN